MRYNTGDYIQRGAGLGSLFGSLFKAVMPAAKALGNLGVRALKSDVSKNLLKTARDAAIQGGIQVAADALEGKNIKESASNQISSARKALAQSLRSGGESIRDTPRKTKRKPSKQKTKILSYKKARKDIFS